MVRFLPVPSTVVLENPERDLAHLQRIRAERPPYLRVVVDGEGLKEARDLAEIQRRLFPNLIVIGMGGSILGTKAVADFCGSSKRLFFLDNPDEERLHQARKLVKRGTWGVLAISKSGTTLETLAMLSLLWGPLEAKHGMHARDHVIALTAQPESPLGVWAARNSIRILSMPADLSGRFSVFSTVGVFPLAFAGYDVNALLKGARQGFNLLETSPESNILCTAAQLLLKHPFIPLVVFIYDGHLHTLGCWYQQLWAESLGKDRKFGQLPIVAVGPADQHSILQMLLDVPKSAMVWIWGSAEGSTLAPDLTPWGLPYQGMNLSAYIKAACQGVFEALGERGVARLFTAFDERTEKNMGEALAILMALTHLASLKLNVAAFNQPAVELAKKITKRKLEESLR